jgi:hypothetical protein
MDAWLIISARFDCIGEKMLKEPHQMLEIAMYHRQGLLLDHGALSLNHRAQIGTRRSQDLFHIDWAKRQWAGGCGVGGGIVEQSRHPLGRALYGGYISTRRIVLLLPATRQVVSVIAHGP